MTNPETAESREAFEVAVAVADAARDKILSELKTDAQTGAASRPRDL